MTTDRWLASPSTQRLVAMRPLTHTLSRPLSSRYKEAQDLLTEGLNLNLDLNLNAPLADGSGGGRGYTSQPAPEQAEQHLKSKDQAIADLERDVTSLLLLADAYGGGGALPPPSPTLGATGVATNPPAVVASPARLPALP